MTLRERALEKLRLLRARVRVYVAYRDECVKISSRHGVMDAEADLREFESQIALINELLGTDSLV